MRSQRILFSAVYEETQATGKPHCVILRRNVKVPVYKRIKKKRYTEYQVPDHTSGQPDGKRKLWSFADEAVIRPSSPGY